MEALAELLGAAFVALIEAIVGLAGALASLLAAVIELVFLLITKGRPAAKARYAERKSARAAQKNQARGDDENTSKHTTAISGPQAAIVAGVGLVLLLGFAGAWYLTQKLLTRRIETTTQIAQLADGFFAQLKAKQGPEPQPGPLPEQDAWGQPLELFIDEGVLGKLVVVRSQGPDRSAGTLDDLLAVRALRNKTQQFGAALAKQGAKALADRVQQLFPGVNVKVIEE